MLTSSGECYHLYMCCYVEDKILIHLDGNPDLVLTVSCGCLEALLRLYHINVERLALGLHDISAVRRGSLGVKLSSLIQE